MKAKANDASIAVVTVFKGMTVEESTNLRVNLRKAGGEYQVIKNTLGRIAFTDSKHDVLKDQLRDNTGIALGFDDPVAVAKALSDFAKDSKTFQIKSGSLDGKPMTVKWTTGTDKPVTFENTYHDLTTQSIAAAVAWKADDDHLADRPDSVTITLFANGAPFRTATVSAADGWRCTFDDLLIYGDGNEKITYTVDETTVPDKYEKSVSGDAERGFVITNTRKADPPASAEPSENGGSGVNTGDTGTIAGWLLLMACSLLTALTAAREKHRK